MKLMYASRLTWTPSFRVLRKLCFCQYFTVVFALVFFAVSSSIHLAVFCHHFVSLAVFKAMFFVCTPKGSQSSVGHFVSLLIQRSLCCFMLINSALGEGLAWISPNLFFVVVLFSYSFLTSATSSAVTYSAGASRVLVIYHSTDCCW